MAHSRDIYYLVSFGNYLVCGDVHFLACFFPLLGGLGGLISFQVFSSHLIQPLPTRVYAGHKIS